MYKGVIKVEPLENYQLELTFDNMEVRLFDVTPYLETGIFEELKDLSVFRSVKVSFDSIEWNNGADLDPEDLYQKSKLKGASLSAVDSH